MKVLQLTTPKELNIQFNTITVHGIIIPRIDFIDFESHIMIVNSYYITIEGSQYTKIIKTEYGWKYTDPDFTVLMSSQLTEDILLQKLKNDNLIDGIIISL